MALSFSNSVCNLSFIKKGVVYDRSNPIVSAMLNSVKSVEIIHEANIAASGIIKITPSLSDAFLIMESGLLGTGISLDKQTPASNSSGKIPSSAANPTSTSKSEKSLNDVWSVMVVSLEWANETVNNIPARSLEYQFAMSQPSFSLSNADIEITLQGVTKEASFLAKEGRFVFNAGTTALQAITNVLAGSSDKSIEGSLVVDYDGASDDVKSALNKAIVFRPYIGNRLEIVKQILDEANLYAIFPPYNGIDAKSNSLVIKGKDSEKSKIKKRFILYRNFEKSSSIEEYPITNLSINPGTHALFVTGNAFGNQRIPFFSDTKEVSSPETGGGTTQSLTSTNSGLAVSDPDDPIHGVADISIARNNENNNHGSQDSKVNSFKDGYIKMDISCPGVFDLFVGQTVEVVIGNNLPGISGAGFVRKVTHFWDGDWITSFELHKSSGLGDALNKATPKANASLSKGKTATLIA